MSVIWCLIYIPFGTKTPVHSLEAWWKAKPTMQQLKGVMIDYTDDIFKRLCSQDRVILVGGDEYRLIEVKEGEWVNLRKIIFTVNKKPAI